MGGPCNSPDDPCARPEAGCCSTPTISATLLRKILLFTFFAIRVAVITVFIVEGVFDITYYTYASLLGITIFLIPGLVGLFVEPVMRFYSLYIFPVLLQSSVLVSVLIVIIVQLNSSIFTSHLSGLGGTLSAGTLHTGDWAAHQYTCVDMLITLIAIHHMARRYVREMWFSSGTLKRVLYVLYTLLGVMLPLGLYAVIEDWGTRYPVPIAAAYCWLIILGLAILFGGLFFMFMISTHDLAYAAPPCHACGAIQCVPAVGAVLTVSVPAPVGERSRAHRHRQPARARVEHIVVHDDALAANWRA